MLNALRSWFSRFFQSAQLPLPDWGEFSELARPERGDIPVQTLVNLQHYRQEQRMQACGGVDPIDVFVAYAQENHIYDKNNRVLRVEPHRYSVTAVDDRVNKFGLAYRPGAPLLLHKILADIVVDAAIDLYGQRGWTLRLYDGLRTVDSTYLLYAKASPKWLADGLLAKPGESAHNRALAIDLAVVDAKGCEIERLDNLDMAVNHRDYGGTAITKAQRQARLETERAFHRAAISHHTVIAPLASEYWDYRMPGSDVDLWRVIHSLARAAGLPVPESKAEDYNSFCDQWNRLNTTGTLTRMFGPNAAEPPGYERIFFHEKLNPIYDADLPESLRQSVRPPMEVYRSSARTASATRAVSSGTA